MINVTIPKQSEPPFTEIMPHIFSQRLYASEQRWEGINAQVHQLLLPKDPVEAHMDCDTITLHLDNPVNLQRQTGTHREKGISYRGGICLDPKGQSSTHFWQGKTAVILNLFLAPSFVEQVVAEMGRYDPTHVEMVKQFNIHDSLIEQIGLSLIGELESGGIAGRIYAESLANMLVLHLLRLSSTASLLPPSQQHTLTQQQISVIQDYIYDRLNQDISLQELAGSLNISVSHFCRLFKQSTGLAPHQFVIACRVERARTLLLREEQTIAQVAQAVGFADQSHLNRHFKHLMGISPGMLRKESKNIQGQEQNIQDDDSN